MSNKKTSGKFFNENQQEINKGKKIHLIPTDTTELLLVIVFITLLIFTIFVAIKVVEVNGKIKTDSKASIVMPLIEKEVNYDLGVDISNMKANDTKDYVFKISNYRNDFIVDHLVNYKLIFAMPSSVEVEVYKNDEKIKSIKGQKEAVVENNNLASKDKQEDIFKLKIKATKKISDNKLLTISIQS